MMLDSYGICGCIDSFFLLYASRMGVLEGAYPVTTRIHYMEGEIEKCDPEN